MSVAGSSGESSPASRARSLALTAVRVVLALVFLAAGGAKLYGVPALVESFAILGFGQWFRYLTGALEVIGAFLVIIPSLSGFGAVLLCCIMVGAVLAHALVLPGSAIPAIVLFVLGAIVVVAERDRLGPLLAFVRR